jgi:U3 small nucleolar RNA-associated protein 23
MLGGGEVKPMITQCDIRRLYAAMPKNETLIKQAQEFTRARCNHQDLDEPLSSLDCLSQVVDPKGNHVNKNHYIVAANDRTVRAKMRTITGVPLIYIHKSILLMEPMASATEQQRDREEKSKFKQGLKGQRNPGSESLKRKRDDEEEGADGRSVTGDTTEGPKPSKKKRPKGPKEPNPLSVKKPKKAKPAPDATTPKKANPADAHHEPSTTVPTDTHDDEAKGGRKRKRKPKKKGEDGGVDIGEDAASP